MPSVPDEITLPRTSWKLRAAALALAAGGAACAFWLQYEGQKFRSQQLIHAERQSRFEMLAGENTSLQTRVDRLRTEAAAQEARLAEANKALGATEINLAKARTERDKAETDRSASLGTVAELVRTAEREQRSVEQMKAQFAEARLAFEALQAETVRIRRDQEAERSRRDALSAQANALETKMGEVTKALMSAEAGLAKARVERDNAERDRAASLAAVAELVRASEREQRTLEQLKAQLAEARPAFEALQAETARVRREQEQERSRRDTFASEANTLETKLGEQRAALARAGAELRDVAQQKVGLTAEIERGTSRLDAAREQNQKEDERGAQARQELAALKQDIDRRRYDIESSRKEIADLTRLRPSLQAQIQTLQQQLDGLDQTARKRQEVASNSEQRLTDASNRMAELDARKAGLEQRSKDLQDLIKDQTKRLSDLKSDADRLVVENARYQEQTKIAESQRRELVRLAAQYEQIEKQHADAERRLISRLGELARVTSQLETVQQKAGVEGLVSTR